MHDEVDLDIQDVEIKSVIPVANAELNVIVVVQGCLTCRLWFLML